MMMFQLRQKVKLRSYEDYGDYRERRGQEAIITKVFKTKLSGFDYAIRWKDGKDSYVAQDNLISVSKFRLGDVVVIDGKCHVELTGKEIIDESKALLVSRKYLI